MKVYIQPEVIERIDLSFEGPNEIAALGIIAVNARDNIDNETNRNYGAGHLMTAHKLAQQILNKIASRYDATQ